jgi:hypothetical protein
MIWIAIAIFGFDGLYTHVFHFFIVYVFFALKNFAYPIIGFCGPLLMLNFYSGAESVFYFSL